MQRGEGGPQEYVGYQSRAGGLTRAILDTMSPIVKFGARPAPPSSPRRSTLEHRGSTYKLDDVELAGVKELNYQSSPDTLPQLSMRGRAQSSGSMSVAAIESAAEVEVGVDPALVDDSQQCPICVEDFADGDDIRVLPCDERHRFVRWTSGREVADFAARRLPRSVAARGLLALSTVSQRRARSQAARRAAGRGTAGDGQPIAFRPLRRPGPHGAASVLGDLERSLAPALRFGAEPRLARRALISPFRSCSSRCTRWEVSRSLQYLPLPVQTHARGRRSSEDDVQYWTRIDK